MFWPAGARTHKKLQKSKSLAHLYPCVREERQKRKKTQNAPTPSVQVVLCVCVVCVVPPPNPLIHHHTLSSTLRRLLRAHARAPGELLGLHRAVVVVAQHGAQAARLARAQLAQRLELDLADALARDLL